MSEDRKTTGLIAVLCQITITLSGTACIRVLIRPMGDLRTGQGNCSSREKSINTTTLSLVLSASYHKAGGCKLKYILVSETYGLHSIRFS